MKNVKSKEVSLSLLVVSTRDYKYEFDWFWDKKHNCIYGLLSNERSNSIEKDLAERYCNWSKDEDYFNECVLMPELHELEIEEAAEYLRKWCEDNSILYKDDLDEYKEIEAFYWGYDDIYA